MNRELLIDKLGQAIGNAGFATMDSHDEPIDIAEDTAREIAKVMVENTLARVGLKVEPA